MSEYIDREAVNALIKAECSPKVAAYLIDAVATIPAADVRPVVLCRDCRHRDPEDHKCDCGQLERAGCVFPVDDDYFCAYGERLMTIGIPTMVEALNSQCPNCGARMDGDGDV